VLFALEAAWLHRRPHNSVQHTECYAIPDFISHGYHQARTLVALDYAADPYGVFRGERWRDRPRLQSLVSYPSGFVPNLEIGSPPVSRNYSQYRPGSPGPSYMVANLKMKRCSHTRDLRSHVHFAFPVTYLWYEVGLSLVQIQAWMVQQSLRTANQAARNCSLGFPTAVIWKGLVKTKNHVERDQINTNKR
jgi:hypothetical protein